LVSAVTWRGSLEKWTSRFTGEADLLDVAAEEPATRFTFLAGLPARLG